MSAVSVLGGFVAAIVNEAAEADIQRLAAVGRINDLTADLFESIGLSLVASGKRGASPKGAHARLALLCQGDAPSKAIIKGIAKDWAGVAHGLHSLVTILHTANACDAPCALPAWADPVALAAAKAAKAAKAAATRAANKAVASAGDEVAGDDVELVALPVAPAANLIAAAIKAKVYNSAELAVIIAALTAANAIVSSKAVEPAELAVEPA